MSQLLNVYSQKCLQGCWIMKMFHNKINKKILLRERKRHTAHRVLSTPSAVLSRRGRGIPHHWTGGGGTPSLTGVPPILTWWGFPIPGWGYPIPDQGTPSSGPSQHIPPPPAGPGWGTPWEGTWDQSLGYTPERTWDQSRYYGMEMGYTPPRVRTDKQTETITFPHPSDAGGNKFRNTFVLWVLMYSFTCRKF